VAVVAQKDLSSMPNPRAATISLESRSLPSTNRSAIILETFDRLQMGGVLELGDETDPRALRNELQQRRPGRFSWDARNLGSGRWTVRIERIDEHADVATFLSHCTAFANARSATVRDLAATAAERSYRAAEVIYDEGEMWPYLAFVRAGKVVYSLLSPEGKTHSLGERLAHDPLNETGTFDGGGTTTRAEALVDCSIVLMPTDAVLHACRSDSELSLGFLAEMSQARRRSIDTIADLAFAHVLQRVAKFLLSYAPATTGMARGLSGVENLSQAQIAAAAGTVRDMAARALLRLRNANAVELERGRVRALDRVILEAFARNVQAPPV
jgi:CRP/FNR family cyclic AMP-dependent transcriptional regulator